jgi:hypothetical protein
MGCFAVYCHKGYSVARVREHCRPDSIKTFRYLPQILTIRVDKPQIISTTISHDIHVVTIERDDMTIR